MTRRPDLPCADCGQMMQRSASSLPEGQARCHACRRARPVHKEHAKTKKTVPCADCGRLMWRGRTSLPEGQARCLPCRRKTNPPKPKPSRIQIWTCPACGIECSRIRVKGQVPKWCTDCRKRLNYKPIICEHCGVEALQWRKGRFCSRDCKDAAQRRVYSTELVGPIAQFCLLPKPIRAASARIWVMGQCQRCDAPFVIRDQLTSRYCSVRCARADAGTRHRVRKVAAFIAPVYRARIFERDQWRCQLCRKKVNRNAVVPHPKAPTLDHILPLSLGGTHEPANVQLACFMCNCLKSDGLYLGRPEQLSMIG